MIGSPTTAATADSKSPNAYFVDALLRTNATKPETDTASLKSEVATILDLSLKHGEPFWGRQGLSLSPSEHTKRAGSNRKPTNE